MSYNKEKFDSDLEWFRGQGVATEELKDALFYIVKESFAMTREEFIKFVEEV